MSVSVPAGSYYRINCALVLEDNPVGEDSRLGFESFPEAIEEVYALTSYREIGADRMPQPGGVAYRGGNWSTFSLTLQFRAGERANLRQAARTAAGYTRTRFEQELREMERKARWCQALCFPLTRGLGAAGQRVMGQARRAGVSTEAVQNALGGLRRNDPPKVLVVFGSWMVIRGYAVNVSLKWEAPYDPVTNRPYGCTATIQIQPLMVSYPSWQSIRAGAWSQRTQENTTAQTVPTGAAAVRADEQARREARNRATRGAVTPAAGEAGEARRV